MDDQAKNKNYDIQNVHGRAFVYYGRLAHSKGVDIIVNCWLNLQDKRPELCPPLWLIGGNPEDISKMRTKVGGSRRLCSYEKSGNLVWWGYLDPPGISAVLLRALVVLTHSKYEPGGRVILEAMSQGVPVIATPHGFAPDLIADWVSGFLIRYGDENKLMKRMEQLVLQPLIASALGNQARKIAKDSLKQWRFYDVHNEVYDDIYKNKLQKAPKLQPVLDNYPKVLKRRLIEEQIRFDQRHSIPSTVEYLAKIHTGSNTKIEEQLVSGKSFSWVARGMNEEIWIKQIHSHFRLTPLWLNTGTERLFYPAEEKFRSELFNDASGIIQTNGYDSKHYLVVMPLCRPLRLSSDVEENVINLKAPLDKLASVSCFEGTNELQSLVQEHFVDCDSFDVKAVREALSASKINKISPWPLGINISLRLWLSYLIKAAKSNRLSLPNSIVKDFLKFKPLLWKAAQKENDLPVIMLHNSVAIEHYGFLKNGELVLLDKERLTYGFKGKDQGELAAQLLLSHTDADLVSIVTMLGNSSSENEVIIAWVGPHLMAEIGYSMVIEHSLRLENSLNAWKKWYIAFSSTL